MLCPCCKNPFNKLQPWMVGRYKCGRVHIFKLEHEGSSRVLVVESDPPDMCGCQKGDRYPVPEGEVL